MNLLKRLCFYYVCCYVHLEWAMQQKLWSEF